MTDRYIAVLRLDPASPKLWRQFDIVDTQEGRSIARGVDDKLTAEAIAAALNVTPIPERRF